MFAERYDTIIVGGGVAGLIAANLLARGGQSVALFERSKALGGRGATRIVRDYYLNFGAHALYKQGAAAQISAELGIRPTGNLPIVDHHSLAIKAGRTYVYPGTPRATLQTKLLSLADKLRLGGVMFKIMRAKSAEWRQIAWRDWVNTQVSSPTLHELVLSLGRLATYANDPTVSAAAVITQLQMVLGENVLYLDRGWQQWIDLLAENARQHGATLHCHAPVHAVEEGAVVLADGTRVAAKQFVLAVPAPAAVKLLPSLGPGVQKLHPLRVASLTVGLSRVPRPNVTFASGIERPTYYSLHSAAAELAPKGGGLAHVMLYLSPDWDRSADTDRAELEGVLDIAQPGWRDCVAIEEYLPRITVAHGVLRYDAARPTPQTHVPNIFVAGDWVGEEGLLADAAAASARSAARMILGS